MGGCPELLDALWSGGAVTVSPDPVTLKSGRVSHVYITLRHFACDPAKRALLAGLFETWLGARRPTLGTVPSLLSPVLAGAFAARCGLPLVLFRPDASEKGLAGRVFGRPDARAVVLVDDVLTSGGTALAAAEAYQSQGAGEVSLFVFVDKRPVGLGKSFPLPVAAPLTLARLLGHGLERGFLTGPAVAWAQDELTFLES